MGSHNHSRNPVRQALMQYDDNSYCVCGHQIKAHVDPEGQCLYRKCKCKCYTEAKMYGPKEPRRMK